MYIITETTLHKKEVDHKRVKIFHMNFMNSISRYNSECLIYLDLQTLHFLTFFIRRLVKTLKRSKHSKI